MKKNFLNRNNSVGIANGLAWTSVGGETLPIEVAAIPNGNGKIEADRLSGRCDEGDPPSWP